VKPLGRTERKIILVAELYRRRGAVPTWTELQRAAGMDRLRFFYVMKGLRKKGLVDYQDNVQGSLRVRSEAVALALKTKALK
jgi:hypothetical protein